MNQQGRKYVLDEKGKRVYPKRSNRQKHFGHLRQCKAANLFHGFQIQPGMWFGEDDRGFFATYGDMHGDLYAVYRSTFPCPMTPDDWVHILEPMDSVLTGKLDLMDESERQEMLAIREEDHKRKIEKVMTKREEAKKPLDAKTIEQRLSKVRAPRSLNLRKSKPCSYNACGRPPIVAERRLVDVDVTAKPRLCVNYLYN